MEHIIQEIINLIVKEKKIHLRGIAKRLSKPHTTVSRALHRLVKESIIDFSIEGRNKYFTLKKNIKTMQYIYMAEHGKLIDVCKKYPAFLVIIEEVTEKTKEELVILFGSYAKGRAKKESDIDIFIEARDNNLKKEIESIHSKLSVKIGKFDKNNLLIKEIIKDHVIIKGVEKFYERVGIFE